MKRHGFASTEGVLLLISLGMIVVAFFAVITILTPSRKTSGEQGSLFESYQRVLEAMNRDFRFTREIEIASQSMILTLTNGRPIIYRLEQSTLQREDGSGRPLVLMAGLASGQFRRNPELPALISVYLLPADQMGVPFYTSFALRAAGTRPAVAPGGQP